MTGRLRFAHPEPEPARSRVWPVFIPFAGCPYRCVYCAQDKQTGQGDADLTDVLRNMEQDLDAALADGRGPYELAFYGGTFTALARAWQEKFLNVAGGYRELGLVTRVRCSTRPDCVEAEWLSALRDMGLDMVELGIQSFDDDALRKAGRGYDGDLARSACALVKATGLALGIQLLPGLPGDRPGVFRDDVHQAVLLAPETVRLYPCLVIRGTPLATLWGHGLFMPWTVDRAREELAAALPRLWEAGIRVIRLGLPPEGTLAEHILAGPWHPALGQSARSLALFEIVREKAAELDTPPALLEVPRRYQGELFGHGGDLVEKYAEIHLDKTLVRYVGDAYFTLSGR
ncbi:radical SAM protein [Pseudodesulfovibrio cashew]|uniref:Radical SAM protein n=1 Tax=Pseudodesulfovibrio cashew TaxID=2678688 RepID=A0A6I6JFT9_9BACT|nr:radical SAM protein [Pseudodesulfovibrio cashew]QGY39383.1 radical SAM protein [Pseudodesulfovibrio cashew]